MKSTHSLIAAALLYLAQPAFAATLVDTGVPDTQTFGTASYRGGKVTFTSNVQISGVQHYSRVRTAGELTVTLRYDDAGLPGAEIRSAVTTLAVSAVPGWIGIDGLHWAVPAGTYWVTVEDRSGQLPAMLSWPLGLPDEPGTFPPTPLASEASAFPAIGQAWERGQGRTGWRVIGETAPGIYGVGALLPGNEFFSEIRDATKVNGVLKAVGSSSSVVNSGYNDTGVLWSSDKGLVALPPVVPGDSTIPFVTAREITADGTVIAGSARASATTTERVAVLVTNNGTTNTVLGALSPSRVISYANSLSDDGAVAYGQSFAGGTVNEAFRWTEATGLVRLGFMNPGDDFSAPAARGTSSDGSVMVGVSGIIDEETGEFVPGNRAFRYVHGSGMTALPLLPGFTGTTALAVNPTGNIVLGWGTTAANPYGEFIRWNLITGTTESLGSAEPTMFPRTGSITADGQVAVVSFYNFEIDVPLKSYVRNAHGWFDLNDVMADAGVDLTGWVLDQVWGVSPEGTLLFGAGQHDGKNEGWVSELPANYLRDYGAPQGDSTAPIITPVVSGTAGTHGWYLSSVSVTWNVVDAESAIVSSQGCGPTNVTSDTSGVTFTCTATSAGGTNTASVTVKRDTVAPTALVLSPLPGVTYDRRQKVPALYLCLDLRSGMAQCTGTVALGQLIDTATKGTKSFTLNARDQAGNTRAVTVQYRVK